MVFSRNTFARECIFFERLTELFSEIRFVSARSCGKRARFEIEVELDADIDAAEARVAISDINEQMDRVRELEDLKEEWSIQVESKDEIEKLLSVNP